MNHQWWSISLTNNITNNINLKLLFYYDGSQMTNALGDTDGVYKCGMFYFSIENLTRKHNSCLKNIFLIAIMFVQDIKIYGFELGD